MHWLDDNTVRGIGRAIMGPRWIALMTDTLRRAGFPEKLLPYLLAQIAHETDGGFSTLATIDHNWSGIRPNNHGFTSGYVDRAGPFSKKNPFAKYANDDMWAKDYKRVLSMKPGRPIDAQNAQQFYMGLYNNGYFTKPEAKNYSTAFNARLKEVNKLLTGTHPGSYETVAQSTEYLKGNPNYIETDAQGKNTNPQSIKDLVARATGQRRGDAGGSSKLPVWGWVALAAAGVMVISRR